MSPSSRPVISQRSSRFIPDHGVNVKSAKDQIQHEISETASTVVSAAGEATLATSATAAQTERSAALWVM